MPFLNETIMTNFTDYARPITIAAAEVNTGEYFIFNQTTVPYNQIARASVSSASMPAVFAPQIWEGYGVFMDGGTIKNVNIQSAIKQCLE